MKVCGCVGVILGFTQSLTDYSWVGIIVSSRFIQVLQLTLGHGGLTTAESWADGWRLLHRLWERERDPIKAASLIESIRLYLGGSTEYFTKNP